MRIKMLRFDDARTLYNSDNPYLFHIAKMLSLEHICCTSRAYLLISSDKKMYESIIKLNVPRSISCKLCYKRVSTRNMFTSRSGATTSGVLYDRRL